MYDLTYISLGAGVQSSALLVASALGLHGVPRADVAVFADTQDEPAWVYEHLGRLTAWSADHGIPVEVCTAGRLSDAGSGAGRDAFMRIPAFTDNGDGRAGMVKRQCTFDYKIEPIRRHVRVLLGYQPGERVKRTAQCLMGISYEEIYRMKPSRTPWITNSFPLIDAHLTRQRCLDIWQEHTDLPLPRRSACVYCPYRSNREWRDLREHDPDGWQFAVAYDERLRAESLASIDRPVYLHRTLVPLAKVDLDSELKQMDMFNAECEGMCGV